jgi:hypothetical protein
MRLKSRSHRHRHPSKAPLISISQEEITADLLYPAPRRGGDAAAVRSLRRR